MLHVLSGYQVIVSDYSYLTDVQCGQPREHRRCWTDISISLASFIARLVIHFVVILRGHQTREELNLGVFLLLRPRSGYQGASFCEDTDTLL
jgi:hypothetical protein